MSIDYPFPSKRIGTETNPKLIILLENNGGNPNHIKWNVDYAMNLDGVYQPSGIPFATFKEYDKWWYDMYERWSAKLSDDEVLSLEYYPYPTESKSKYKEIYPGKNDAQWKQYANEALAENIKILKEAIAKNIPIFVYYSANGNWYKKVPELETYSGKISHVTKGSYPNRIKSRFSEFITSL